VLDIDIDDIRTMSFNNLEAITIRSDALVKTYDYDLGFYKRKRFVFDFNKLKYRPVVKVKCASKEYKLDLKDNLASSKTKWNIYQVEGSHLVRRN